MLYFNKGLERLDKEADIAYIVQHVRIMRYFLKTVLDKDQRVLLKLKAAEWIPSDCNEYPKKLYKKKVNKEMLLERYVEHL